MGEIIIGLVLIALCLVIFLESRNLPSLNETHLDAGSFPALIAIALIFLCALLIIQKLIQLRKTKGADRPKWSLKKFLMEYRLVLIILGLFFAYIYLMQWIGFVVTSIIFIIGAGLLIGTRKKKEVAVVSIVAIVVTLSTYFFFENVLHIRFPSGLFF